MKADKSSGDTLASLSKVGGAAKATHSIGCFCDGSWECLNVQNQEIRKDLNETQNSGLIINGAIKSKGSKPPPK